MSVSLREKLADFVMELPPTLDDKQCLIYADQILSLFPPQLTEEQLAKTIWDWSGENHGNIIDMEHCRLLASALIGKCATPTFSGGEKKSTCEYGLDNCSTCKPTEQKEYCECKEPKNKLYKKGYGKDNIVTTSWCMNEGCGKPIPAEKKECLPPDKDPKTCDYNMCGRCMRAYPNDYECQGTCNNYEPEPEPPKPELKPKDRPADK